MVAASTVDEGLFLPVEGHPQQPLEALLQPAIQRVQSADAVVVVLAALDASAPSTIGRAARTLLSAAPFAAAVLVMPFHFEGQR